MLGRLLCLLGYHQCEPDAGSFYLNFAYPGRHVEQVVRCLSDGCGWSIRLRIDRA